MAPPHSCLLADIVALSDASSSAKSLEGEATAACIDVEARASEWYQPEMDLGLAKLELAGCPDGAFRMFPAPKEDGLTLCLRY